MAGRAFPVRPGEMIDVEVTGLNHAGEGVGRCRGAVVFIPGAVPGELVRAAVAEVKKGFARARLEGILRPSPERRRPACALHGACGGCDLQHLAYAAQLRWKTQRVKDALARIGGLAGVPVGEALGMERPYHYRTKVHLQVGRAGERLVLGFYARRSRCLPMRDGPGAGAICLLADRELLRLARTVEDLLNEYGAGVYDWQSRCGYLRHVVLRRARATGESMVVLVTGREEWAKEKAFVAALRAAASDAVSVVRNINTGTPKEILGPESRVLSGRDAITEILGHLRFRITAASFFQVNPVQTLQLCRLVREYAALTGRETLLDVYCGVGTFGLFLAGGAYRVVGIEAVPAAVADAQANAALNGVANAAFYAGAAERLIPAWVAEGLRPDVAVLDPPRRGCDRRVLAALAGANVPRVVYVSCDPATLARDLGYLFSRGYQIRAVQPVDMFPHTRHIECVAVADRGRTAR